MSLATEAIALGIPVFPCDTAKRPVVATGFKAATAVAAEIAAQFAQPRAALIGVPTGEVSGWDALDVDPRHGGDQWEAANVARLPETRIHETPSGGRHYIFLHAPGVRNSAGLVALGVDVRGTGGYICAPPSPGYKIISDAEPCHWPDWLLELVLRQPKPSTPPPPLPRETISSRRVGALVENVLGRVRNAAEGQKHFVLRNAALTFGGLLHLGHYTTDQAVRWLLDALPSTIKDRQNAEKTARWDSKTAPSSLSNSQIASHFGQTAHRFRHRQPDRTITARSAPARRIQTKVRQQNPVSRSGSAETHGPKQKYRPAPGSLQVTSCEAPSP